jgi:hypothetical protein
MLKIVNRELFGRCIAESLVRIDRNASINTGEKLRWVNALGKAAARMESSDFLMTWQPESETMVIWTVGTTNQVYAANGSCQCRAYLSGNPCWHLAAKQLYKRYLETESASPAPSRKAEEGFYSKQMLSPASEKLNGVRI